MHGATRLCLVKAQVQPAAKKIARLGHTAADTVGHNAGDGVGCTHIIRLGGLEKSPHITPGRKTHAQHIGILCLENHLVQLVAIKAVFQANLRRVWHAGEGVGGIALGPCPISGGDCTFANHLTTGGFSHAGYQP